MRKIIEIEPGTRFGNWEPNKKPRGAGCPEVKPKDT
jgi:hypothetical protein